MNFKYITTIIIVLMILALSRGVIVHYRDLISFGPFSALAQGEAPSANWELNFYLCDPGEIWAFNECPPGTTITSTVLYASYYASVDKDTYAQGETVNLTMSGNGNGDNLGIGESAVLDGVEVANCQGTAQNSCNKSFNAPTTLGVHTLAFTGCWANAGNCNNSSLTFTVAPAAAPVVWTNYCTGGNDPNGNNWQIWAKSNETPPGFKFIENGNAQNGCIAPTPPVQGSPVPTLTQSSESTVAGESFTVGWGSTNATSCTVVMAGPDGAITPISNGPTSGGPFPESAEMVGVYVATNTCTGPGGTNSANMIHTVTAGPPTNGCIKVLKETFDTTGNKLTPVAQFTFTLDGVTTVQNNASGDATFTNVTPGAHQVVETSAGNTWKLLSVTPAGGNVTVQSGSVCAAVVFKNQQTLSPPPQPIVWTNYCTGGNDPNGNNWQIWAYSNENPPSYKFLLNGNLSNGCVPTPVCTLSASPPAIQTGDSSNLTWTMENSPTGYDYVLDIDNGIGRVSTNGIPPSGTKTVSPSVTTTYTGTMHAINYLFSPQPTIYYCSATVTVTSTPPPPPPPPPPPNAPTCVLTASPTSIQTGNSSTLSWLTTGATSFTINHGVSSVTPVAIGSHPVSPTVTTTYTGTATGAGGSVTCTTTVTVTTPPPPPTAPTCMLSASPTSIQSGGSSTLSWTTTTGATSFVINNSVGSVTPVAGGSTSVSPTTSTTYTGTVTGPGGSSTCAATITVTPPPPPGAPICTLVGNPSTIQSGSPSQLTWTTTGNATSFVVNQNVNYGNPLTPIVGGSITIMPAVTTTYTGTVTGPGGSSVCTAIVTVTTPPPPPQPVCTLTANPTAIQKGSQSSLSWTTSNATKFTIDQGIGEVMNPVIGSVSVGPQTTTTYTGTATGAGGSVTCGATITVTTTPPPPPPPPPPAPACTLTASPTEVTSGGTSTLTWTTANAVSFSINTGIGSVTPVAGGSTTTPAISANTTFTGTATNSAGSTVTCTAAVSIKTSPPPGGCTSNCGGGGGGGGGGGSPEPKVTLSALPHVGPQSLAYLYLSQIPNTGLELGTIGTAIYWLSLILWALALAYLVLFGAVPFANVRLRNFGARVSEALNAQQHAYANMPRQVVMTPPMLSTAQEIFEAPRGYSSYDGFKSFAKNGALSIDDIVKGLSHVHSHSPAPSFQPPAPRVEPIYENVEPIEVAPVVESAPVSIPANTRGFVSALVEGDRVAVFAGLRQHLRGGGSPEQLISPIVCLLDDAYRARVDGTDCDADVARITARLNTPVLEKLIASLSNAIDSSYTTGATGAKLALTRALAVLGA